MRAKGVTGWPAALLISTLAFLSFYFNAYFSSGYRGMLGYENKDTLAFLQSYFNSALQGSTLLWDPVYLQYTPRFPQAPIYSPITQLFVGLVRAGFPPELESFMPLYLLVLALIQIGCTLTMFFFLRTAGFGFWPSIVGGLIYSYNHQTFAFGINHGYERISAVLMVPLFLMAFFRALESRPGSSRRRFFTAAAGLLTGLALVMNADIKPTAFFLIFLALVGLFYRPFSRKNLITVGAIIALALGIFAVQALPTIYSLPGQGRGAESVAAIMDFSLTPAQMALTHFWTGLTPRWDYHWENTLEFSLSLLPLVMIGLAALFRHRWRNIFLAALAFSFLWILGKYSPLAALQGWVMQLTALRHPVRMAMLLYFCYAFLAALGTETILRNPPRWFWLAFLLIIPLFGLGLRMSGTGDIPLRFIVFSLFSCLVLLGIGAKRLPTKSVAVLVIFFILERTTVGIPPEKTTVTDPTVYYPLEEIYRHHPRVKSILENPEHRRWRAFFAAKEFPEKNAFNLYLNAFTDGIRPIFTYLYIEEEMTKVREVQEVIFDDWSHPMWSLLNVKYFVDLEGYFDLWGEEYTSRTGLESLIRVDEHVRVNPRSEEELFVRYRRRHVETDEWFLEGLRAERLDLENTAYLDGVDPGIPIPGDEAVDRGGEEIEILERKPDEIIARVRLPRPGVLVFSEFWFWPWRVTVDGESRHLRRAYHILQAVELEAGEHMVSFYFNSRHPAFLIPVVVSIGLIVILGLYCLVQIFKRQSDGISALSDCRAPD